MYIKSIHVFILERVGKHVCVCGTRIDFDMIQSAQTCTIQYVAAAFRNRLVKGSEAKKSSKRRDVSFFKMVLGR
jgi:hypothetical protein